MYRILQLQNVSRVLNSISTTFVLVRRIGTIIIKDSNVNLAVFFIQTTVNQLVMNSWYTNSYVKAYLRNPQHFSYVTVLTASGSCVRVKNQADPSTEQANGGAGDGVGVTSNLLVLLTFPTKLILGFKNSCVISATAI